MTSLKTIWSSHPISRIRSSRPNATWLTARLRGCASPKAREHCNSDLLRKLRRGLLEVAICHARTRGSQDRRDRVKARLVFAPPIKRIGSLSRSGWRLSNHLPVRRDPEQDSPPGNRPSPGNLSHLISFSGLGISLAGEQRRAFCAFAKIR